MNYNELMYYNELIRKWMNKPERTLDHNDPAEDFGDYDTSWDWLMPVVEKINSGSSYDAIHIDSDRVFVHRSEKEMLDFEIKNCGSLRNAVYLGVVAMIEHLNMTKNVPS